MRTSNPVLTDKAFSETPVAFGGDVMTVNGAVQKTAGLLFLTVCSAAFTWSITNTEGLRAAGPWAAFGALIALIAALIIYFKKDWAAVLGSVYALAEGLFLGAFSAIMEAKYSGIVVSAVGLTLGTLAALLLAYRSGVIKATENFKLGVVAATGGICLVYLAVWILSMFGVAVPYLHNSGPIGIAISLFVVVVAALNLVLDFDFIERGAEMGAPRYMEWYAAFGMLVTLVWLYIEFMRLIAKLQSRR